MKAVLEYTEQDLQSGTRLGPYRLIKQLQQGGMSTVYLGYDMRSEVFSVGILLYQLLTGYVPFDGASDKICLHHWQTQPLAPSMLNPSLPRQVERVILRALEKDPRHRYQTVEDLLHAFQMALDAPTFFEHISTHWLELCQKSALTCC